MADNFFKDKRPKIVIFPTSAVCNNFYRELRKAELPNRYSTYLDKVGLPQRFATGGSPTKKALELQGILKKGRVAQPYLDLPERPSAPLRAFSYTQAR